jgi:diguanylate cyclase (GGDEF)-like protein
VSGSLPALDGDSETYNAMILRRLLEAEVGRSLRHGRGFSLLMVRISRLEGYSAAGRDEVDREVIKMFAAILKDEAGPGDIIGRTDLTEFAIIFPEANREVAQTTAERIHHKAEWTFGVNYSVVEFPSEASDANGLIDAARASLERASVGGG